MFDKIERFILRRRIIKFIKHCTPIQLRILSTFYDNKEEAIKHIKHAHIQYLYKTMVKIISFE